MNSKQFIWIFLIALVGCKDDQTGAVNGLEGHFEKVWNDFNQTYSYFELKGIDWDSVYNKNRSKVINGQTTSSELADILGEMTLALRDIHVRFTAGTTMYQFQNRDQFASNAPSNAPNYLSSISFDTNTLLFGDIRNLSIAYLRVKNLSSRGDFQPLASVPSEISDKAGLILDLRDNEGGSDAIARSFVNKITGTERIHELVRFRNGPGRNDFGDWIEAKITPDDPIVFENPIVVLINRGVASSAESFVTMMMTLPNTTLVGDTTRGSTGNPKEFTLSNGWRYRVSSWQAVTPEFEFIEDHGIAPDIAINNTAESMNEGRDLILEKAIELLQ